MDLNYDGNPYGVAATKSNSKYLAIIALVLVLPLLAEGVHNQSLRDESEDNYVYQDLDYGSNDYVLALDNHSTTDKPKHHVHSLVMASDLNYTDLCGCFSPIQVSKDCRIRYPDDLRTLRNGSIQLAYNPGDESLVQSKTIPLLVVSSGLQKTLKIENESLVLLCESSLDSSLQTLDLHHISRLHMNGQILQIRSSSIHLTFNSVGTPILFNKDSLKFPSSADDSNSTKLSLNLYHCTEVTFESNSIMAPNLILNAVNVNQLKLSTEAIKLTSKTPILQLRIKGKNGMKLSMDTDSIIYGPLDVSGLDCVIGASSPVVVLELIGAMSLAENALTLLPCTNLTLRKINLVHAASNAITNVPGTKLNWVHVKQLTGNGGLAQGSICLIANTVWATDNQIYSHTIKNQLGDVIMLSGAVVTNTGSTTGVHTCEQQNVELMNMEGCQICQRNKVTGSTLTKHLLYDKSQISKTTTAASTTSPLENQEAWYHNNMVILYLVVAASIILLAIIASFIIHAINKRKKRMSWKVPSLPWAKSHYNSRHPALAAKAAYSASQNITGKPECYTIFDSIAAAKQVKQPQPSLQIAEENHSIDEKQDQQECTYSEPIDTISSSRRHSHIYAYPSNIKGGESRIDRLSSLSDRRLSASTASVASSIADLNMISALSTQDRRKSSYGLLIDITSALGIESNYKQLTNK